VVARPLTESAASVWLVGGRDAVVVGRTAAVFVVVGLVGRRVDADADRDDDGVRCDVSSEGLGRAAWSTTFWTAAMGKRLPLPSGRAIAPGEPGSAGLVSALYAGSRSGDAGGTRGAGGAGRATTPVIG
jgi:hypothetical protein